MVRILTDFDFNYRQSLVPSLSSQKLPLFVAQTIPALPDESGGDVGRPCTASFEAPANKKIQIDAIVSFLYTITV